MPQGDFTERGKSQLSPLERADQMITDSTRKPRLSWPERLKEAGFFAVFLIGGFGGGSSFGHVLEFFGCPDILVTILMLTYWCVYGTLMSKIELNSDKKNSYARGYSDGYAAGQDEGLVLGVSAKQSGEHNRGYQQGLADGRSDGFSQGYEAAQRDTRE